MKRALTAIVGAAVAAGAAIAAASAAPATSAASAASPASATASTAATAAGNNRANADEQWIERGAYVAKAGDCAGCHTAPQGGAPFAGGAGLGSPFGSIVSTNITPDPRYGIGSYTLAEFARAVREGVAKGGKRLYPAMPYASFSKMTDEDVRALYLYIMKRVAPVAKAPPKTDVAFPFNQRWLLRYWQLAFAPREVYRPKPGHDAQWNRGAYLVQGLGHCGACHTPRGAGYQERGYDESSPHYLTGGVNDHWFAPNLTGDAGSGLGRLTEADIAAFLKTGHGAGAIAYGTMVEQVEDSTQYLTDDDARAIAHYLKSLPAQQTSGTYTPGRDIASSPANGNRVSDALSPGANVYRSFCARCHGADGAGIPRVFPALAGNPSVLTEDTTSLIRLLVEGGNSPSTIGGPPRQNMPRFADTLSNAEIAQVLTYIRSQWGNNAQPITGNDVATLRGALGK